MMTVRELRDMLDTMDDSCTLTMQTPDGMERDIVKARPQGDHLTFWTEGI